MWLTYGLFYPLWAKVHSTRNAVVWMQNDPHRFVWLNPWSLLVVLFREAMGPLGGRALLEEMCNQGRALRFHS